MSFGVGHRHNLDLVLLWLWHRPAATVLIRPLAWEPPDAEGVALKKKKKVLRENYFNLEFCVLLKSSLNVRRKKKVATNDVWLPRACSL